MTFKEQVQEAIQAYHIEVGKDKNLLFQGVSMV
jgi:hypothetical protein